MRLPRLVILAGGQGSRMGGDKLRLRDSAGRLLVSTWFDRLAWPALPLLVLPPGGDAPAEVSHWPIAHDAVAGDGPLRGVEAAMNTTTDEWLLIVAVDTPGLGREQLDWIANHRQTDPAATLWMAQRDEQIEPFPLLIHRSMAAVVSRRLNENHRSLHGLATEPSARMIPAPTWPATVWINLNRPEDLKAYLVPSPGTPGERGPEFRTIRSLPPASARFCLCR